MDDHQLRQILRELRNDRSVACDPGLTSSEVEQIEQKYGFRFPPDLRAFLQIGLPVSGKWVDWRHGSEAEIRKRLAWPLEGMLFDVKHSTFWMEEWGPKPNELEEAFAIVSVQGVG